MTHSPFFCTLASFSHSRYPPSLANPPTQRYNANGSKYSSPLILNGPLSASAGDTSSGGWGFSLIQATLPNGGTSYEQNSPVGIALFDASNTLLEFICFEGVTEGVDLDGRLCTDTLVREVSTTPTGWTLQRVGSSNIWRGPVPDVSWGVLNNLSPDTPPEGLCPTITPPPPVPPEDVVIINELHYHSHITAAQRQQWVELRANCPGMRLDGWHLYVHSSSTGLRTSHISLAGATQADPNSNSNFGYFVVQLGSSMLSTSSGVIALADAGGQCRELWGYGTGMVPTFQVHDGPCVGQRVSVIGVIESSSTQESFSLQRVSETAWVGPQPSTQLADNNNVNDVSACPANYTTPPPPSSGPTPELFISEVSYDDGSGQEFIELQGCLGMDITGYSIVVGLPEGKCRKGLNHRWRFCSPRSHLY